MPCVLHKYEPLLLPPLSRFSTLFVDRIRRVKHTRAAYEYSVMIDHHSVFESAFGKHSSNDRKTPVMSDDPCRVGKTGGILRLRLDPVGPCFLR